jgi:hypothetical protein
MVRQHMPKNFKSLSDVLSGEKEFLNFRKSVKENDVIVLFNEIFPEFKKLVSPSNVHKGVLYLSVDNSVLRNEIHLRKKQMIEKINSHLNQQLINDVKFTNFRNINRKTK